VAIEANPYRDPELIRQYIAVVDALPSSQRLLLSPQMYSKLMTGFVLRHHIPDECFPLIHLQSKVLFHPLRLSMDLNFSLYRIVSSLPLDLCYKLDYPSMSEVARG
jgi:hypothetical protein